MKKIIACLLLALLLSGCGRNTSPETTAAPTQTTAPQPTTSPAETTQGTTAAAVPEETEPTAPSTAATVPPEPTRPVTVYHGAQEAYLLPLEQFSSDREHAPEYVMLHFTSAVVIAPEDPYNMETVRKIFTDYGVSIHYIIDRDGAVYCYIPEDRVAWHAGKGSFSGQEKYTNKMNHYAIGIELVGMGSKEDMAQYISAEQYDALPEAWKGFTEAQYDALIPLAKDICSRNGIEADREHIIGHQEYSPAKTDPGSLFDWERLIAGVK